MNLAALWTHERARLGLRPEEPPPGPAHEDRDRGRQPKRQSSTSTLVAKKKASVVLRPESAVQRLLEASAVPRQRFDRNEFAIEYADRAPKRFLQQLCDAATADAATAVEPQSDVQSKAVRRRSSVAAGAKLETARTTGKPVAVVAVAASLTIRRNPRKRGAGAGANLELSAHAFKPYVGDMFSTRGDYVDGMLYMSRMKRSHQLIFGNDPNSEFGATGRATLKDAVADALSAAVAAAAVGNLNLTAAEGTRLAKGGPHGTAESSKLSSLTATATLFSEIPPEEIVQLKQRQRCSLTLSNWSSNPENARLMVQENVVDALILLCRASDGDRVTKLNCVTALMNLSNVDELRSDIVQQGAVKTLVGITNDSEDDKTLRTACAVTLCNLCCCVEGEEEALVEDGAVGALSLLITDHPKTAGMCLGALYNLTCVKEPYHKIESVLKVFLTLVTSSPPPSSPSAAVARDEIIAKAVCNLSNVKRVRLRLMEEGIVSAVSNLTHPSHPQIQHLLAYVILNLSATRACRSELVAKGGIGALIALTGATQPNDTDAKSLIALSLWNLSKEAGNRLRMVFEGLLLLVNELVRGVPPSNAGEPVRAVCARTLYNVTCSEETRPKLVERDAVSVLSMLSQRCTGDAGKKMCTLALCNLLSVQQAASDIVSAGAITSLIELSMATEPPQTLETKQLFAKALCGLCEITSTRAAVVNAGIIPAVIHLSSTSTPSVDNGAVGARQDGLMSEIRALSMAALTWLAGDESISSFVRTPDVVRCVMQALVQERSNIAIERFCCACLSLLCRDEQCSLVVAEEEAVQAILSTCLESQDQETKSSCCHVLASMSVHESCCMALMKAGVLPVLATLAKASSSKGAGSDVQRCCAIALANLSADEAIRGMLVAANIVPLISLLSNTYSEGSQRDCARVLCNLSSVHGHEQTLVQEGALEVLMMIAMVRALQPSTKATCVRAFANLTTAQTIASMVGEGIVKVLPTLVELIDSDHFTEREPTGSGTSLAEVIIVLFGKVLCEVDGRRALCLERAALRSMISLHTCARDGDLFQRLLFQLVFHDELRERSVDAGVIDAMHQIIASTPGLACARRIAKMAFLLAMNGDTRASVASPSGLASITSLLDSSAADQECILYIVSTLCHLAWHEGTRARLKPEEVTTMVIGLLQPLMANEPYEEYVDVVQNALLTLCCLSHSNEHLSVMLESSLLSHLLHLAEGEPKSRTVFSLICILYRQLTFASCFGHVLTRSSSQTASAIKLFCLLSKTAAALGDRDAALNCADALCSITFISPVAHNADSSSRPTGFVRRQSQPQVALRGSMAVNSSVPLSALISAEVLGAIEALLICESTQLPETRWRCAATLHAFSCISSYRHSLVQLGCTRLLVAEASLIANSTSAIDLAGLRSCAGALCNLTIVTGPNADANAQAMVQEGAVPALICIAKRENDEIREYCTLALSNLSSQSPKVESGAVSALLNLSLHGAEKSQGSADPHVGVARPPPIVNAMYKDVAGLPEFEIDQEALDEVVTRKYPASQIQATLPPPPLLPTIPGDLVMVGGLGRQPSQGSSSAMAEQAMKKEEAFLRRRKSSSISDLIRVSPTATPWFDNGDSRGGTANSGPDCDLRGWSTLAFTKIDPVEARALSMEMESESDPAANEDGAAGHAADASESSSAVTTHNDALSSDSRSESEDVQTPLKQKSKSDVLSPLARVIVRKTQTSQAVSKFKELKAGAGRLGPLSSSASALPLATVQETQELALSASTRHLNQLHQQSGPSKAVTLRNLGTPKTAPLAKQLLRVTSDGIAADSVEHPLTLDEDGSPLPSIAAAAAAAMLYSSGPSEPLRATALHQPSSKKQVKSRKSRQQLQHGDAPTSAAVVNAQPPEPFVKTVEEVQTQARLFGLWS